MSVPPVSGRPLPRTASVAPAAVRAEFAAEPASDGFDAAQAQGKDRRAVLRAANGLGTASRSLEASARGLRAIRLPWFGSIEPARVQVVATFKQGLQDAGAALAAAERQVGTLESDDVATAAGAQTAQLRLSFDASSRLMGEILPGAQGTRKDLAAVKELTAIALENLAKDFHKVSEKLWLSGG